MQDEVPVALERRAQRLAASQLAPQGREQNVLESSVDYVPGKLRQGLGRLAGVQSLRAAAAQLAKEPLFCLETGVCVCVVGGWGGGGEWVEAR